MLGHNGPISGIACFGKQYVATAGYDNHAILWHQPSGEPLARGSHDHLVNSCTFSSDGKLLVTAGSDRTARLWSVPDMQLMRVFVGHSDDLEHAVFIDESNTIITCSRDHSIRMFDFSGKLLSELLGHTSDVIGLAVTSNNIVSSSDDGTVRLWSLHDGKPQEVIDLGGAETDAVAVGSNGTIFAGNDDGTIFRIERGTVQEKPAHDAGVKRLVFDEQRGVLVSLSYDRTVKIWSVTRDSLTLVQECELPAIVWARAAAFCGDGSLVFGTFGSCYARLSIEDYSWSLDHIAPDTSLNAVCELAGRIYAVGDSGCVWTRSGILTDVGSLCNFIVGHGDLLICGGQLGMLFDAKSGALLYTHHSPLNAATFVQWQRRSILVVATYTGQLLLFDCPDSGGVVFRSVFNVSSAAVKDITSSTEDLFFVTAAGSVGYIRDLQTMNAELVENAHDMIANSCACFGNGRFISVSRDRTLRVWVGLKCRTIRLGVAHSVKSVAASDDGKYALAGTYGGQCALIDLTACATVCVRRVSSSGVSSISFDTARKVFLATTYDGMVHTVEYESTSFEVVSELWNRREY